MGDIVEFPGGYQIGSEDQEGFDVSVRRALIGARRLKSVMIVGREANGELFFASTYGNPAKSVYLLEKAKKILLECSD